MNIRTLHHGDVPLCLELCAEAGWNQTARDWLRLMALAPTGCFGIDAGQRLVATATVVSYGQQLAWIGMVLVRPAHRGQGLARALLQHALDYGRQHKIACLKLDATALGEPVYRKLGFVEECGVERWVRQPGPAVPLKHTARYVFQAAADRHAFGADRSALLWLLEREEAFSTGDGSYALGRPGTSASYFGPCVTASDPSGPTLLACFLASHIHRPVFWDRFSANAARQGALFDFAPVRHLKRMYLGENIAGDPAHQFALAGFELG